MKLLIEKSDVDDRTWRILKSRAGYPPPETQIEIHMEAGYEFGLVLRPLTTEQRRATRAMLLGHALQGLLAAGAGTMSEPLVVAERATSFADAALAQVELAKV